MQDDDIAWEEKDRIFLEGKVDFLKSKHNDLEAVALLEAAMFKDWDSTSATPGYGIFHQLYNWYRIQYPQQWPVDLMQDVQYWKSSRVCESFIVLFDRPDGTIMVQDDYSKVYLVCGWHQSVGEAMHLKFENGEWKKNIAPYPHPVCHGLIAGIIMNTTLVPLEGKIFVPFGSTHVSGRAPTYVRIKALEAYVAAVNSNTLISALPKKEGTSLKSVQYRQKSLNYATPSMTTAELDKYLPLKEKVREYLDAMRYCDRTYHALMSPEGGINIADIARFAHLPRLAQASIWITTKSALLSFPEIHAHHELRIYDIKRLLGVVVIQRVEPTIPEYLLSIKKVCEMFERKPTRVVIDCDNLNMLQLLAHWLQEVGIEIAYSPLKSKEECDLDFFGNLKCPVCNARFCSVGLKLLRCGGCKDTYYCSKEHQKKNWKQHKDYCKNRAS